MAYFSQDGSMHGWNGPNGYIPSAPVTRILCDGCAKPEVPFETITIDAGIDANGVEYAPSYTHRRQCAPWKWTPIYGASCHQCGKPA